MDASIDPLIRLFLVWCVVIMWTLKGIESLAAFVEERKERKGEEAEERVVPTREDVVAKCEFRIDRYGTFECTCKECGDSLPCEHVGMKYFEIACRLFEIDLRKGVLKSRGFLTEPFETVETLLKSDRVKIFCVKDDAVLKVEYERDGEMWRRTADKEADVSWDDGEFDDEVLPSLDLLWIVNEAIDASVRLDTVSVIDYDGWFKVKVEGKSYG